MRLRNIAIFMVFGRGILDDGDGGALRNAGALSIGGTVDTGEPIHALMMCWRIDPGTDSKLLYWLVWPLAVTEMRMPLTTGAGTTDEISGDGVGDAVASSGGQIASDDVGAEAAGGRGEAT